MSNHTALDALLDYASQTEALSQVAGRLGWDQETVMPRGAARQRSEEMGAMAAMLHERRMNPRIGEWLALAEPRDAVDAAKLRHIRRDYDRANKLPESLAAELARTTSIAHGVWAEARANDDVAAFLPMLEKVVDLRRQEAACLANGGDLYDALVDDYEPGMTGAEIAAMFDRMRPRLVALREAILGKPAPKALAGNFAHDAQLALTSKIATAFGYDLSKGRIDLAVHPFSSGSGSDVRITTRVSEDDPFGALYSTIHEVGHACYEQNIDADYALTPLGQGVSMGVHESQSRIYENQLGRSKPFTGWLFDRMGESFGNLNIDSADGFFAAVNRVASGYIRTEADEVHYNLHVMLRFDLERALIKGDLQVADMEAAWNDRFKADFGLEVDRPSNGMLQDVHWSEGLFGYFPTYSLGNVYAGCLHQAMRKDLPDLDADLGQGQLAPATGWLREKVQRFGGLKEPRQVIADAVGEISEAPLLEYLEAKFASIYDL
ncbi:carboxypeptidase M32 [Rhodophyticola sp. SM2404]